MDSLLNAISALPAHVRPSVCDGVACTSAVVTGDAWAPTFCALVDAAESSVFLAQYAISFRWPLQVSHQFRPLVSLSAAAERGLVCRAVLATHSRHSSSAHFNIRAARSLYDRGFSVRLHPRAHLLHAKLLLVDGRVALFGSHNISHASSASNVDLSVLLSGSAHVAAVDRFASSVWSSSSIYGV